MTQSTANLPQIIKPYNQNISTNPNSQRFIQASLIPTVQVNHNAIKNI
jgi:hypothetical protein